MQLHWPYMESQRVLMASQGFFGLLLTDADWAPGIPCWGFRGIPRAPMKPYLISTHLRRFRSKWQPCNLTLLTCRTPAFCLKSMRDMGNSRHYHSTVQGLFSSTWGDELLATVRRLIASAFAVRCFTVLWRGQHKMKQAHAINTCATDNVVSRMPSQAFDIILWFLGSYVLCVTGAL